jgi:hypothetical protein
VCVDVGHNPDSTKQLTHFGVPLIESAGTLCSTLAPDEWWVTRFEACIRDEPITFTVLDQNGNITGEDIFAFSSDYEMNSADLTISESDDLVMTQSDPAIADVSIEATPSCSASCAIGSGQRSWGGPIDEQTDVQGSVDYLVSVDSGVMRSVQTSESISFVIPGGTAITPAIVPGAPGLRCDAAVGSNAGCVDSSGIPEFILSLSDTTVDQAAAGYLWAQEKLPDAWGTPGHELRRLADNTDQETNRAKVCDSTFVKNPTLNADDSCDEFAFAATYQSGGQLGLTGINCEEIFPFKDTSGNWEIRTLRGDTTAHCQQAHVDQLNNTTVGGDLGNFTQNERVLDMDEYQLIITQ